MNKSTNISILGGGLAGLSMAYFLQNDEQIGEIHIFEKEDVVGGLCRSFMHRNRSMDIGPHIFFSKDEQTLKFMLELLGENVEKHRRSNRILYQGRMIQYPFENDLSKLPEADCRYCVDSFLKNPYREYPAGNMLQFFLKTFGGGITNLYLRPYNEKIWKFDPCFMDTQMVERIPQPPDEDILRSAAGETVDGYLHQLYFYYPKEGGTSALIQAIVDRLNEKVMIHTGNKVETVKKCGEHWRITTNQMQTDTDRIVSCMPVTELIHDWTDAEQSIKNVSENLKYNNIMIGTATVSRDVAKDNYAFMIPDKEVVFHRLNKVDFLGNNYSEKGTATYMMEYTYRNDDRLAECGDQVIQEEFINGLQKIRFIKSADEVIEFSLHRFPYAYVIYDLEHQRNMAAIREYCSDKGIILNGRFGNFEYWNMDRVIAESKKCSMKLLADIEKMS